VFLAEALAPSIFRRSGQARFEVTVMDQQALPREAAREHGLDGYSAVCLLDPGPLEPGVWQKLGNFVSDGHGLAVFLGRAAQPVEAFNGPEPQELLAGKLLRQARAPDGSLHLAPRSLEHPILAPLRSRAGSIPWDGFPVFRYWQLELPPAGVGTVVPYSDGGAAVLERALGRGRVLTMTTPVSDNPNRDPWNLLPIGEAWPFLILANEMASYLVGGESASLNYYAGQTAVTPLDPQRSFGSYVLTGPDGADVRLAPDPKQNVLVVAATEQAGNYRIQAGGSSDGVDRGFSVNLTPEQTRLDRLPEEELARVFGPLPYRLARNREQIETNISTGRVGRELFSLLIVVAALALALEHVVANRFYKE
jgi:hypothetical protein